MSRSAQRTAHASSSRTPPIRAGFRFTAAGRTGSSSSAAALVTAPSKLSQRRSAEDHTLPPGSSTSARGTASWARSASTAVPAPLKSSTATRPVAPRAARVPSSHAGSTSILSPISVGSSAARATGSATRSNEIT